MAITSVKLVSIETEGDLQDTTETEVYHVVTDAAETARTVRDSGHADLPQRGDADSSGVVVTKVQVEREKNSRPDKQLFIYTVTWSTPELVDLTNVNPLSRPAEIHWEGLEFIEYPGVDADDVPFRNSAGDMYNPQPERIVLGGACTITRNESGNPANTCVNYSQTTNNAIWHGVALGLARFGIITADKQIENGITFWRVTYPVSFNRKGWKWKAIDNGFNENIAGVLTRITDTMIDENGTERAVPRNIPSYLNGSGGALPDGGTPVVYPSDGFTMFEETGWGSLSLPNPFA